MVKRPAVALAMLTFLMGLPVAAAVAVSPSGFPEECPQNEPGDDCCDLSPSILIEEEIVRDCLWSPGIR